MADSPPDQCFHVRSISFPSRSHPTAIKLEEVLHKLKTAAANYPPSSPTEICNGLRGVSELYTRVEDLLHLPSLQQTAFTSEQRKRLEEELELSVQLLDLVDNMKNLLVTMSEHIRDLRLALRRRGSKNLCAKKEMKTGATKCYRMLKKMGEKCGSFAPLGGGSSDLSLVIRVLVESRDITLSVLACVLHFLSMPWQKQKGRWSFAWKTTEKRKAACLLSFYACNCTLKKDVNDERIILQVQEELTAAADTVEALETELQGLLRRQIQCRVSFLNILSLC